MSKQSGLSIGYLSNLERNICSPTLQNIQKICEIFGNSLSDLLEHNAESNIVVRKENRQITIDEEKNIRLETIDFGTGDSSFSFMKLDPHSSSDGLWWTHEFDEVGTVLQGSLTVMIDDQSYELNEGDSILIKAHSRHCYYNTGSDISVTYWSRYWNKEDK
jgi:mannose-6-phosphate isomerase-like protein (cupin superfamily)